MSDILKASHLSAVEFRLSELLKEREDAVINNIIRAYRNHQYELLTGLAGQLHELDTIQNKVNRDTLRAIEEIENG